MEHPELTMAAGPVDIPPRVASALARPVLYHYDPAFIRLYKDVEEKLRAVFRTKGDVVIMHGEALLGLEAAAFSCIAPGTKCLNIVTGVFGKWFEDFITMYGGEVVELAKEYNQSVTPDEVRQAFRDHPGIRIMSVVHSETPSGTVNPVHEICSIAKEHGALTVVDSVSGVGGMPMQADDWGVDMCIAGPQKCLGGSPGLALLSVSDDAWSMMRARNPNRNSYLGILDWKEKWIEGDAFPYTPSVSLVYGLHEALTMVLEEGLEAAWQRHDACARACRAGIRGMGLELWPESEANAASSCTAFRTPDGVDSQAFRRHLRDAYGVMIAPGYGPIKDQVLRIGHMGHVAKPVHVFAALTALGKALHDGGVSVPTGRGIDAALAEL